MLFALYCPWHGSFLDRYIMMLGTRLIIAFLDWQIESWGALWRVVRERVRRRRLR
jgi:hypothetical protein